MNKLQIFTEKKQELTEIAFVKDTPNQVRIRDIKDSYEVTKQLTIWVSTTAFACGIKHDVEDIFEKDVKDLILMRFSGLSLDELHYAFKLERFKVLGEKTEHFQSFNADYVSTVLDKYIEWKRQIKSTHNISAKPKEITFSESEKIRLTSNAIRKALDYFLEHLTIPKDYVFVYDELVRQGFLNQSVEFKKQIYADAIELLETELTEKKAASKEEHTEIGHILENLREPKQPAVILKCKELTIIDFFRTFRRDEKALAEFQEKYKIIE